MGWVWRIQGVAFRQFVLFKRQWMWLAQSVVATLGLIAIFGLWGGVEALKHMVVVLLVVSGWNIGLNIAAQSIGWDKVSFEYEKMVASPLNPLEYMLGSLIGAFLPFFASELPLALLLAALTGVSLQGLTLVILLSILGTFLGLFLSLSIVLRLKNPMNISAVTNPLATLTTMLPPVYYTPLMLPEPLRAACIAVPTTVLVDLGRAATMQAHAYPIPLSLASLAAWTIATALLTKFKLKWGLE
ncbi:MAG: ABC transporter permease [Thermofilaceae archaeon]